MKSKIYANKGVNRNKKPLKNLIYKVEVVQLKNDANTEDYSQYKFKDKGYLVLRSGLQSKTTMAWNGFITPLELKELLGEKQWAKFCNGKREFIIQRRINGKNISKKNTAPVKEPEVIPEEPQIKPEPSKEPSPFQPPVPKVNPKPKAQ